MLRLMRDLLKLILWVVIGLFRSRASLEAEIIALRHQLIVPLEIRQLIRAMSLANPLWGAPRIHGELLKLGIEIGQTSVAKYMENYRNPHRKGGRRSSAIMPMGSPRWTSLSFRHSRFDCFMACSFYLTAGVKSYGWA